MTIRNVGLAAGIGILASAGSLVAAQVAKAEIDFECKPGCWAQPRRRPRPDKK
jgi:hypothetical protein